MVEINDDNKIVVGIIVVSLALAILMYVVYPPLRGATGVYGFLSAIALTIYTNPSFQEYLYGIPRNAKNIMLAVFIGAGAGIAFIVVPKLIPGMSMGLPLLPASVDSSLRWIIQCVFAPFVEDIIRFSMIGLVLYLARDKGITKLELWIAIIAQAVFFTALHATSYAAGWYEAPTLMGALGVIGAVQASLIAAFIFAVITGFIVTRDGMRNILASIVAHYMVNQILFVKMAITF